MNAAPRIWDAVVVGSGPNGLTAACRLARAGYSVNVIEASDAPGGGARSAALTLPGFVHDTCSSAFPFGPVSPAFAALPLRNYGLQWIHSPASLAHPLPEGSALVLERSLQAMVAMLGRDGPVWRDCLMPFVARIEGLLADVLAPPHWPAAPALMAKFGWLALRSARGWAEARFREPQTRALLAGLAMHGTEPIESQGTAAIALLFAVLAHAQGWPVVAGGTQRLTDALTACFRDAGGEIEAGRKIETLADLPPARCVLLDITPKQSVRIAGSRLSSAQIKRWDRFRYGPGVFKVDWALSAPIPWRAEGCARAATVHVGGDYAEICVASTELARGRVPRRPVVILVQPGGFDPMRAPPGRRTAWGYCHVPPGCTADCTELIESQVERFAPGFCDVILARSARSPRGLEAHNANCVGGDIAGGAMMLRQLVTRPYPRLDPYASGVEGMFLCSASTPPGPGVHGMAGWHAARRVMRTLQKINQKPIPGRGITS